MKLKRERISFMNLLKVFKGLLFFGVFLLSFSTTAQTVNVTLADGPAAEEGVDTATFRITMSALRLFSTTINYTLTGSAVEGRDYQAVGTVSIPPIQGEVDVIITPIEDAAIEGNEDVVFTLLPSRQYTIGTGGVANTVIEDNDIGKVTLVSTIPSASEDGPTNGRFQIRLSGPNETGLPLIVTGDFGGDATATGLGQDFTTTGNGTFTNATQTAKNINIIPVDDTLPEAQETVTYTLTDTGNPWFELGDAVDTTAAVTIDDNDCAAGTTPPMINGNETSLCDEPSASVNLNSFVTGGGSSLRWSTVANPTDEVQLLSGTAVTAAAAGTYYAVFVSGTGATFCTSPVSDPLVIVLNTSPSAGTPTNVTENACNNANALFTPREFDLDDLISGEDAGNWMQTDGPPFGNIPNDNLVNFDNKTAGVYEFTFTTTGAAGTCTNKTNTVTITVSNCDLCVAGNSAPALIDGLTDADGNVGFCGPITSGLDDLIQGGSGSAPAGTTLRWSTSQLTRPVAEADFISGSAVTNPNPGTYYGYYYDAAEDCISPRLTVSLISKVIPNITNTTEGERCGPGTVALSAMASNSATINWYATATSVAVIGTGSSFTTPAISTPTSYFVEATLNGCVSGRQQVTATIRQQPSSGTPQNGGNASACSVTTNGPTILDLDDLISGEDVGQWVYTSGPFADFSIPSNNIINFEGRPDGNYVFTFTTTGAQAPCVNESTVMTITVNDCDVDTDMDGLFDGPEATLGTDPNNPDTDGDGINDGDEVGTDTENPLDSDVDADGMPSPDGLIDARDSNILDTDGDGVVNQLDPANENPCIPNNTNGLCDTDEDGITDGQEIADGTDPMDPCDPNLDSPVCVDPVPIDLEIKKEVDNLNALLGEEVTFTISLVNLANSRVKSIKVKELLESGFEYISHDASVGTYDIQSGEWQIFEIEPLSTHTLSIKVEIVESGAVYSNTAELLESFPTDNNADNNVATLTLPIELPEGIDLVLEKTALSANPLINEEVIFTIKVINASIDANPVNNIEVRDVINATAFEYIDHNTVTGVYDEGSGIWSIPSIDKGQEVLLEIRVKVPNEGEFTNTATIIRSTPADGNPANNEAIVEVMVSSPTPAEIGFLYNQFSPNGDGTNDVLEINRLNSETNREVEIRYNIQIFNRYGNLVFEANNKSESEVWDGSWKGDNAPNGTYFYTMILDVGTGPQLKKGWIQLIR